MTARAALIALAATAACLPRNSTEPVRLAEGGGTLEVAADGRSILLQRRGQTLLRLPADAWQVGTLVLPHTELAGDPYWLERTGDLLALAPPADLAWQDVESAQVSESETGAEVQLRFSGGITGRVALSTHGEGRFTARFEPTAVPADKRVAWLRVRTRSAPTEGFYGLGGWPDQVDHRGTLRPVQLEADLSVESANNELHVPVPLLVGTTGWGLFVESRRMGLFDVARKEADLVEVTFATDDTGLEGLTLHLLWADHPLDVTRHLYALTGAPRLPAPWALGPWIWRNENRDQAEFLDDARTLRELDLATSGMWIDRPYARAVNTFDFDPVRWPDPAGMIAQARGLGLRVALWHAPYVEEDARPYRAEAADAGYFPPRNAALLNHWGAPVDFTNAAAKAWWQGLVGRYVDLGIEGFKLDYAEDVIPSFYGARNAWLFSDGRDEREMHHGYTLLYHQTYAEVLPEEAFLLCRAGRWGDQVNVSVIWPGDLDATFTRHREEFTDRGGDTVRGVGGLPASVAMGLNLGVVGFPFFGADTGGYLSSPPDNELYIRWFEQTALSSVMQVGDASSQPPWVFTPENGRSGATVDLYRRYARLHMRLFPLAWTLARQVASTGHPLQRPVGLAWPELGEHPADEYLFGADLLVAPVMERGAVRRSVLFPPGRWRDWWTGNTIDGPGRRDVAAPLDTLPLFLREGAIIPMLRPTIDTTAPAADPAVDSYANDPGVLHVRAFPGAAAASFTVFDGTRIGVDGAGASVSPGATFTSGVVLELLGVARPAQVVMDGAALPEAASADALDGPGFAHEDGGGGALWVRVPAGAHEVSLR